MPSHMQGEGNQNQNPPKTSKILWIVLAVVLGFSCLACVILAAILLPMFSQAKQMSYRTKSMSNIKMIGTGIIMYTNDYDDVLPKSVDWQTSLKPYVMMPTVFMPPYQKDPGGYAFNKVLSGVSLTTIAEPQYTPMVFESSQSGENIAGGVEILRRVDQQVVVGHADSAVKGYLLSEAEELSWEPKLIR